MSQEEVKKYFDLERKKHFDFFIPFYRNQNWLIVQDNINSGCKNDWDIMVEYYVGKIVKIDEKVRTNNYDDCLIEIMQDLKTGTLGWYFGDKDWVLYGSWLDIEKNYPTSLYLIKIKLLRQYIENLDKFFDTCVSKKGWGITWNIVYGWETLINKKIVQRLI